MLCLICETAEDVRLEPSRTSYSNTVITRFHIILDEPPEDPNQDIPLCRKCAVLHHEEWDDRWREYYVGLM
jgi:uncharacterized protein (DUF1778 family)